MTASFRRFAAALSLGFAASALAEPIQVNNVGLELAETRYSLYADFHLDLTAPLLEALKNGVSLGFLVEFELTRPRWYWFDEKSASEKLELRLAYLPLAQQYRLSSGTLHQNFPTLAEALQALGTVHGWPVLGQNQVDNGRKYIASVRLRLNPAIALALLGLVAYQLAILARQRRAKVFGSLLTFRVLVMFALVGVVPGLLVYTVSLQFLAKSIESWFDVRVERALEGGLNLGRAALDVMLNELLLKAHVMALDLSETPRREQPAALARLREQAYVEEAWLMTEGGQVLARVSREPGKLVPPGPSPQALRDARQVRGYGVVEPVGDKGLLLRVIVSLESPRRADEPRLLQLTHWVPQTLAEQGESVQSVYRAYKELSLSRQGLKEIYILTLTLTLFSPCFRRSRSHSSCRGACRIRSPCSPRAPRRWRAGIFRAALGSRAAMSWASLRSRSTA